ncbi:MAG: hypothetical protein E7425_02315 [Ruminococcaceae bacterium]|nr:hypothetical protein [Oscillospiraceae bacterium]
MKHRSSPLVWLCAAGAVALSALPVIDPNGVYAGYTAALDKSTPVIAAVFTAAQDGVYPWSTFDSPEEIPYSPAYRPLTGTVTNEEMHSSVGNEEPFQETVPAAGTPADAALPDGEASEGGSSAGGSESSAVSGGEASAAAPEDAAPAETGSSGGSFVTVDLSWFDDALFIGDSHTEGFCDYAGVRNATYYYKRGIDIWSVMNKSFVGGKQTIPQALTQHRFGKIYIMLGINEIGCGTTESFAEQYGKVISQLRTLQPDALIYIQSIFHTSQKKSDTTVYNNDRINARNEAISHLADGEHVFYIDCNAVFDDENGALQSSYSGDGVHVKAPYYTMWRDYLLLFGRQTDGTVVVSADPTAPVAESEPAAVPEAAAEPAIPVAPAVPVPVPAVRPDAAQTPAQEESALAAPEASETPNEPVTAPVDAPAPVQEVAPAPKAAEEQPTEAVEEAAEDAQAEEAPAEEPVEADNAPADAAEDTAVQEAPPVEEASEPAPDAVEEAEGGEG